jgi:hypothetical protein
LYLHISVDSGQGDQQSMKHPIASPTGLLLRIFEAGWISEGVADLMKCSV